MGLRKIFELEQYPVIGSNVTQVGKKGGDTILNILLAGRKRFQSYVNSLIKRIKSWDRYLMFCSSEKLDRTLAITLANSLIY